MNAHIINCDDERRFLNQYRVEGYVGVGIYLRKTSKRGLLDACRTTYSMYADMKAVFPGDIVFVHAGEHIYGLFRAESTFKENPDVHEMFLSPNIHYNPKPRNPSSGWQSLENGSLPSIPGDYRELSFSQFVDGSGNNLCFEKGFEAKEVFNLRRKGELWSIPERWKYPDSARTVRPLMLTEAKQLCKLLERENADTPIRMTINPRNLDRHSSIQLILNPAIAEDEKIIEAWLCENLQRPTLQQVFGNITSFGNNVQMGYLQGIDIFGYTEDASGISKYKIIEVKIGNCSFPLDIQQTLGYMDWTIEYLRGGNAKSVEGYIVARSFDDPCRGYVKNHNKVNIGRRLSLVTFDYEAPLFRTLKVEKIL